MDLSLALTFQQQNDNKAIVLTDTTTNFSSAASPLTSGTAFSAGILLEIVSRSTLDFTSYGSPDNTVGTRFVSTSSGTLGSGDSVKAVTPTPVEITAATLATTVTGIDETATSKDSVNLYSEFGSFSDQDDMIYTITSDLLGDTADTELDDGLYELVYSLSYSGDGSTVKTDTLTKTILVYGQVKVAVYEKFRAISTSYNCNDKNFKSELSETSLMGAYLDSIENDAYIAKTEELIDKLVVLTSLIENDSNITW